MNIEGLGISLLNRLKQATQQQPDLDKLLSMDTSPIDHSVWHDLLQRYVSAEGWVDYEGFISQQERLEHYLADLSTNPANRQSWPYPEQLAYWINLYNAFTIKVVLDHYPVVSIRDIAGKFPFINSVFDLKFFEIGGQPMDLNTVEHQILRKVYTEPRIHFAINCASFSCPMLLNEAYTAEKMEAQLEQQARRFINDTDKNHIQPDKANLSKIFAWYEQDFTIVKPLRPYINTYSKVKLAEGANLQYLEYDWSLNTIPSRESDDS